MPEESTDCLFQVQPHQRHQLLRRHTGWRTLFSLALLTDSLVAYAHRLRVYSSIYLFHRSLDVLLPLQEPLWLFQVRFKPR